MPMRWIGRCVFLLCTALLLTACSPTGLRQSVTPQHSLAQDGGARITLRASCLPAAPACNVTQKRDAAIGVLARRLAERGDVHDPVVRADGTANIVVELPDSTGSAQIADITTLLTESGAVAILDTGETFLQTGTHTAGQTCTNACAPGQYRIMFTGDQVDRSQVGAQLDNQSGKWVVIFGFAGSARQQFATYTATHIGHYLTITANDVVVESATIQSEIDGAGQITDATEAEAKQLAAYLKAGALPAALAVVSSEQIMPSAK